jgi:pyrimidine-specific ribonucleoside hydrolase
MVASIPVILDVDTGIDDAFALLLAALHPKINLLGVTCVDGNAPLEAVVQNTLRVLDAAGRSDVPVVAGAHRPLVVHPHYAFEVHGTDGFGDIEWPTSVRTALDADAVTWLHRAITTSPEPVTLVTLAPLTNIALLFQQHPDVQGHLARFVVIGGSAGRGRAGARSAGWGCSAAGGSGR